MKDWEAEATKWKHFARKHETAWEKATAELDALSRAGMTDAEKAIVEAESRGRMDALKSIVVERAQDKLEAAAAKAGVDLTPVLKHLDVNQFVADGDVNSKAIGDFVSEFVQFAAPKEPKFAQGLGIGPQGSGSSSQLTREQLSGMSPREISQARKNGHLDALMRGEI